MLEAKLEKGTDMAVSVGHRISDDGNIWIDYSLTGSVKATDVLSFTGCKTGDIEALKTLVSSWLGYLDDDSEQELRDWFRSEVECDSIKTDGNTFWYPPEG